MAKIDVLDLQPSNGYSYLETAAIMHNVTQNELTQISGGLSFISFGSGVGLVWGAFQGGWQAGQWLNENTPIQEWIRGGIDRYEGR